MPLLDFYKVYHMNPDYFLEQFYPDIKTDLDDITGNNGKKTNVSVI